MAMMASSATQRYWQALPRQLADDLRPLVVGIADEVMAEIHAEIPEVALAGASFQRNLRAGIDAAYEQMLAEIGNAGAAQDRGIYAAFGRAQCRAGRGFDEMMAFYRLSGVVFWRRAGAATRRGDLSIETVLMAAEGTGPYLHEISGAAARGYVEEQTRREQTAQSGRHTLVRLLLQRPQPDDAILETAAAAAGWPLPATLAVVALAGPGMETAADLPGAVTAQVDSELCVLVRGGGLDSCVAELERTLDRRAVAAVGPVVSRDAAAESHSQAVSTLELIRAGAIDSHSVARAEDHLVELLVAGNAQLVGRIADRRLSNLDRLDPRAQDRMLDTLGAWLANPHRPTVLARELHLHVQTVRYRLERLRHLFGDALDDPDARFELALALRARSLLRNGDHPGAQPGDDV